MEATHLARWAFRLRSRHATLLHDHDSGTVARHARPNLATGRRYAGEPTARAGVETAHLQLQPTSVCRLLGYLALFATGGYEVAFDPAMQTGSRSSNATSA